MLQMQIWECQIPLAQLGRDIFLGGFACLAFLLPIYLVQLVLANLLPSDQQHQVIEMLQENYSPQLLQVAWAMAVFSAPIYEEFVFRLLFQGWLEKWEDHLLEKRYRQADTALEEETTGMPEGVEQGVFPWLPHGWAPILISGVFFGAVHMGQGNAAPISLSLLGVLLGYLYQRTHRIFPCIAAHMLFNAFTMTSLWLQLKN